MQNLTKELMGIILNVEVNEILGINENHIDYTCLLNEKLGYRDISMNIHEFAHKCKEWLENNTHWDLMIIGYEVYLMEDIWGEGGACNHKRFTTQREWFLNLFDACEYIMKLKEIK